MRNVGVEAAYEQGPHQVGAYMGFFMLVPRVRELLENLDLVV